MDQELTGNAFKRFMRRRGLSSRNRIVNLLDDDDTNYTDQLSSAHNEKRPTSQAPHRSSSTFTHQRDSSVRVGTPVSPHPDNIRRTQSTFESTPPLSSSRCRRRADDEPGKKQYRCEYCNLPFGRKHHKERHVANIHRHEKPYVCDICGHPFHQKPNLDRHRSTVHSELTQFDCEECDMTFPRRNALRTHVQTRHDRSRRQECTICRLDFSGTRELSDHMRAEHSTALARHARSAH